MLTAEIQDTPLDWNNPFLRQLEQLALHGIASLGGRKFASLHEGASIPATCISLLKVTINTGILFLPYGFLMGGWLLSSIIMLAFAYIGTTSIIWLSRARAQYGGTYEDLAGAAIGKGGFYITGASIFLTHLGCAIVGVIFINKNLKYILEAYFIHIETWHTTLLQLCVYLPLCLLRQLSTLASVHLLGDFMILLNVAFLSALAILNIESQGLGPEIRAVRLDTSFLMFGTAVYTYEGFNLIAPVRENMKQPEKFETVLISMMIGITIIMIFFGLISYLSFGDGTDAIATMTTEMTTPKGILLLIYLLTVMLSFPITLYPSFSKVDDLIGQHFYWMCNFVRWIIVIVTVAASYLLGNRVHIFIMILGSALSSPLSYIIPAVIHLKLSSNLAVWEYILVYLFVFIGIIGGLINTLSLIYNW
jgi:proton-coupled amino acid transporter